MGFFDFLKKTPKQEQLITTGTYFDIAISEKELRNIVDRAIAIFQIYPKATRNQLIDHIKAIPTNEEIALAVYQFIPIAYCRLFIPEPHYVDEYVVQYPNGEISNYILSEDSIYKVVLKSALVLFKLSQTQDQLLAVLSHSADFNAINEALHHDASLQELCISAPMLLINS